MRKDKVLTNAELGYFAELFEADVKLEAAKQDGLSHMISVTSDVPQLITSLLGKATFTLLAEVGNFKLWFPLEMALNESGEPIPVLGIPEVLDHCGKQRSWRLPNPKELKLSDSAYLGKVRITSLSSTGLALQIDSEQTTNQLLQNNELTLCLPDGQQLKLIIEPVRQDEQLLVTRITASKPNRDLLRRFLFQSHRQHHQELYQGLS